jgi:hypothetical protein
MLKKLVVASACMMAFAIGGYAEKLTKTPVDLEIYGALESVYKIQNDYRTPLDSADFAEEAVGEDYYSLGNSYRDGANNRSKQNVRAKGSLTMVARSGENDYEGKPWYNLIGVMKLTMDPNDPDYESVENKDGDSADNVGLGDVWIRYSPAVMVGVKIGTQTVAATANMYGIGYTFVGDLDGDFIYWTAAVVDEKPGISVDLHLSSDIELGVGILQGMGDFSAIVSGGGKSDESTNTVLWLDATFGPLDVLFGHQTIAVGGKDGRDADDKGEDVINQWEQKYSHSLTNAMLKFNIGDFSPFVAYQNASGTTITDTDLSLTTTTLGLIAKELGPGTLAFEYTSVSTPEYGEDGAVAVGLEVAGTTHLNYQVPLTDTDNLTVFYNNLATKADEKLDDAIDSGSDPTAQLYKTTSTTSIGVAFTMKFGN